MIVICHYLAQTLGGVTNRWKIEKVNNLKSPMYFLIDIHVLITKI